MGLQTHHLAEGETVNDLFDEKGFYKMDERRTRTLFLDRDGVLNERIVDGYVTGPEDFQFLPGVMLAMRLLRSQFDHIILLSNQQGIGKGLFTMEDLQKVHRYMQAALEEQGTPLDAIYVCPHLAAEHCGCRKPETGMVQMAFPMRLWSAIPFPICSWLFMQVSCQLVLVMTLNVPGYPVGIMLTC